MSAQPVAHDPPARPESDTAELLEFITAQPDDGYRYEIFHGELVVTPPAAHDHQGLLEELRLALQSVLPAGWRTYSETGILAADEQAVPDLIILDTKLARTRHLYTELPVRVAIEIESPSTKYRDRRVKPDAYARQGIDAYWRIERDGTTHVSTKPRADGTWDEVRTVKPGDSLTVTDPFEVTLSPAEWL